MENIIYLIQTLEFRKPAFVGDSLVIEGIVRSKSDSTRIIVLETSIKKGEKIKENSYEGCPHWNRVAEVDPDDPFNF